MFYYLLQIFPQSIDREVNIETQMVHWLAVKRLPFNFFDDAETQEFFKAINPHLDYPKKDAFRRRVLEEYTRMKNNFKVLLDDVNSVSFTIDAWTSTSCKSFYGITIHFIDDSWKMHSLALDFVASHGKHTGKDIANIFVTTLTEYNLKRKVQGITLDNAAANTTFISNLGDMLQNESISFDKENQHFRCFSHILNLGVQDVLKFLNVEASNNESNSSSEDDDSDISDTDSDTKTLNSVMKVRKTFKIFKYSEQLQKKLQNCCDTININYVKPQIDVRTRWNSTYKMLKVAIDLKPALIILNQNIEKIKLYQLNDDEWELLEKVLAFLKHFNQLSTILCGEKYPTLPMVVLSFNMLLDKIDGQITDYQNKVNKTAIEKSLLEAFLNCKIKLMKHYLKSNWVYCCILILDPRHKVETFSMTSWGREMKTQSIVFFEKMYRDRCQVEVEAAESTSSSSNNDDIEYTSLFEQKSKKNHWKHELNEYLELKRAPKNTDILEWWKAHELQFPTIAKMAKDLLSIQATSVASERLFSQAGLINTKLRSSLNEESNKCLLCINSWCKSDLKNRLIKVQNVV